MADMSNQDLSILFVDYEVEVTTATIDILLEEGYKVKGLSNAIEAIEFIKNNKVDILIIDFFIPGSTIEDVVKSIREFNKEIVILLQAAFSQPKSAIETLRQLNIQGYHEKSEGIEKLLLWVASAVRICTQQQEIKEANQHECKAHKPAVNTECTENKENTFIRHTMKDEKKLIEQDRLVALGKLVGGISHNLKTPIMSLAGGLEALLDLSNEYKKSIGNKSVTQKDHCEIAEEMISWIERLKPYCSYMSELITTVKAQAVSMNSNPVRNFTIEGLLKKIEILMKYELRQNNCTLNVDSTVDERTKINGDINNLIQVINNLISNSIQAYEGKSGKIDLVVHSQENSIEFILKDYAKGMTEEVKSKLFKEMITTKGEKGTGLGLYVSYALIKNTFNGEMWIKSEKGSGTEFYINIPTKI